jgi:hypothetical protein
MILKPQTLLKAATDLLLDSSLPRLCSFSLLLALVWFGTMKYYFKLLLSKVTYENQKTKTQLFFGI